MAGSVGRPALPAKVHYLHGNASKKPLAALLDEFSPDVELPNLPAWVKGEAKVEYMRLGQELERYGLVSKLDRGVLVMMATEWARWAWAEKKIADLNQADKEENEKGLVATSPNGYKVMSVYLQIQRAAQSAYLKLASEFGLTPAARTRVQPSSSQIPLPLGGDQPESASGPLTLRSFA